MNSFKQKLLNALMILPLFFGTLSANDRLPNIGDFITQTPRDELLVGRHWLYQSRTRLPILIASPQMQEYIEQLVYEMTAYSGITNPNFEIILVGDGQVNAFAVPGGVMGFHLGLLTITEQEDELASVIAHELGHISQRHYAELVAKRQENSNLTIGALVAGVGFLLAGLPSYGIASIAGGVAYDAETTLKSIRLNETEADNVAYDIMVKSGRDPHATITMFEHLLEQSISGQTPLIFRTHPLTESRISQARTRTQSNQTNYYQANNKAKSPDFFIARSLARVALSSNPDDLIQNLSLEAQVTQNEERSGIEYALATLYESNGKLDKAQNLLENLLEQYPLNTFIHSELARVEFLLDNKEDAENRLKRMLKISPNSFSLNLTLVTLYIEQNKNDQARQVLEHMSMTRKNDLWVWTQLEYVYGKLKMLDLVHYAKAERFFLLGHYQGARDQLIFAGDKTSDKQLKFRINRRIKEIQAFEQRLDTLL